MIRYICDNGELLRSSDYVLREIDVEPFYEVVNCKTGKVLKCSVECGYTFVRPSFNGNRKKCYLHRLILSTFDPIGYFDGAQVNHIDEVKTNNKISNLEWMSQEENVNYGTRNQRATESLTNCKTTSKPVLQFTKSGEFVAEYPSSREAQRQTEIHQSNISKCCNGHPQYSHAGGYIWKWK